MLAVNNYRKEYIIACAARMDAQLAAYERFASGKPSEERTSFERLFFASLVLALDHCFVHRTRALEGIDGNALNEVRMLSDSLLEHNGVFTADKNIKYSSARSVLMHEVGDRVRVDELGFRRLSRAFFAEIRRKFV